MLLHAIILLFSWLVTIINISERVKKMVTLGFFVYGKYYGREDGNEGHIEIASRILSQKEAWKRHFETQAKTGWRDPVDFLVYIKGAVKIGNRWGKKVITYSSFHLDNEMQECISYYKMHGWRVEDIWNLKN